MKAMELLMGNKNNFWTENRTAQTNFLWEDALYKHSLSFKLVMITGNWNSLINNYHVEHNIISIFSSNPRNNEIMLH